MLSSTLLLIASQDYSVSFANVSTGAPSIKITLGISVLMLVANRLLIIMSDCKLWPKIQPNAMASMFAVMTIKEPK